MPDMLAYVLVGVTLLMLYFYVVALRHARAAARFYKVVLLMQGGVRPEAFVNDEQFGRYVDKKYDEYRAKVARQ